tara:strand:- start:14565 stop:14831 length:267 start_codon:yes stop_codon:yes gene_type:complete
MLHLGQPSIRRALGEMLAGDLLDWFEHYLDEPWGWEVDNYRSGSICAAVYNATGRLKKAVGAGDFYPLQEPPAAQSVEEMEALLMRLC